MLKKLNFLLLPGIFLCCAQLAFSQNLEKCGHDNKALLNRAESTYLDNYLAEKLGDIDLSGKKVLFITGSAASREGSKAEYFDHIRSWNEKNSRVASSIIKLDAKEKEASGGYDLIITYWVKIFTERRQKKIIRRLAKGKEI
ncbi:MAG: hypothetical protein AAGD28_17060 [Bacteroidota bacterium]